MPRATRSPIFGGQRVKDALELETALLDMHVGDTVQLAVRRGKDTLPFKAVLAEMPKPDGLRLARAEFGLQLVELKPEAVSSMRLAVDRGMFVNGADKDSPAKTAGFEKGNVIVQIDQYRAENTDILGALLVQVKKGDAIRFWWSAGGRWPR